MRVLVCLLLLTVPALADKVEPVDACMSEAATLRLEIAQLRQALMRVQLQAKYRIADGDEVDLKTLEIRRAPKPDAKPKAAGK